MKIFITGGSGLLGSKIAEIALEKYEVYVGYCHNKPELGEPVKFDLAKDTGLKVIQKMKPEVIIHTAALTNVDECESNKELAYELNVEGTKRLVELAKDVCAFFVYVSTDYVFPGDNGRYNEEDEPNPINYYGHTKLLGEKYCGCIARPCVIYGAKPASGKINFALWIIKNLSFKKKSLPKKHYTIKELKSKEKVKIVTDQYITPTLNTSLAKMLLEMAERELKGIFHTAGKERVSRYEFALRIADTFGLDKELIKPSRMDTMKWLAKRPEDSSLDTSKVVGYLKEEPYSLDIALGILKDEMGNAS